MTTSLVEHAAQQKDNLCGPFWAARVLRDFGFTELDGAEIDEDLIALHAGTVLPEPADDPVPPGARSRTGYRFDLPTAPPERAGTAADALAAAIESAAAGTLRCVPLRGEWTAARVERLVGAGPELGARLLANVQSGRFWGSRPPVELLLSELAGEAVEGPAAEWDVGHYCELEALIRGPAGALVLVHDSYPTLGLEGRHLQPARAVAAALNRGDRREGGVLAVAPVEQAPAIEILAREGGLTVEFWDNGSRR